MSCAALGKEKNFLFVLECVKRDAKFTWIDKGSMFFRQKELHLKAG